MTCAHVVVVKSLKNVVVNKGVEYMLEFEEYRLSLDALEKDIIELRDSL